MMDIENVIRKGENEFTEFKTSFNAEAMKSLVEKYGSGFIRVRKAIADYPTMEFSYRDSGNGFTSEFSYTMQKSTINTDDTNLEKTTEKTTEKILHAIKSDPYITTNELAEICNVTADGIYWNIKKLKNQGLLTRIGPDKGGYWQVNE